MEIKVNNLHVGYNGHEVLHDLNFSFTTGQCISIIGPNGCGKTTLLKALNRLIPYEGDIFLDEKNIRAMSRRELSAYIAWMSQFSNAYFPYTVKEAVELGRYIHKDSKDISHYLQQMHIEDIADRTLGTLSGGQLQKVLLTRTLAQETPIIFLDEPLNHLDLKVQEEIMAYLKEWLTHSTIVNGKEIPNTLVCVMHDMNIALPIADMTLLLNEGSIVSYGCDINQNILNEVFGLDVRAHMKEKLSYWQ